MPSWNDCMPGEGIDPVAEIGRKPAVDDRQQRRHEFAVGRIGDEERLEHAELVGALLDLAAELLEQIRELSTVSARDGSVGLGAAAPGRLPGSSDGNSCGLSPATFASRSPKPSRRIIRACSSPRRIAIALRCPCTSSCVLCASSPLVGQHDRLQPWMLDRRRIPEREEIEHARERDEDDEQREAAQRPVPPVQREASHTRRGARDQNDVQLGSSQPFPSGRVRRRARSGRPSRHAAFPATSCNASFAPTRRLPHGPPAAIARKLLAGIVRRHLPRPSPLRIRIAEERDGQLELAADAGAIAAIVRQRSAELLTALTREGWEFTGIRVRVQVRADPPRSGNRLQIRWIGPHCSRCRRSPRRCPTGRSRRRSSAFSRAGWLDSRVGGASRQSIGPTRRSKAKKISTTARITIVNLTTCQMKRR